MNDMQETKEFSLLRPVPFHVDLLPEGFWIRPGLIPGVKKYVVIHNTGNYNANCDACWHNTYIHTTTRQASWHFTVDDKGIWQHIPICENAWHAGDGGNGEGNYFGIGIELCVNGFPGVYEGEAYDAWERVFRRGMENCAVLTASLLRHYQLDIDAVRQHYDFAPEKKNCPMQMRYDRASGTFSRENGTLYREFLEKVREILA